MIGFFKLKSRQRAVALVTVVTLVVSLLLPVGASAATATPDYTCGTYGGSSYGSCDTQIPGGGSSGSTSTPTTTPTAPTTTTPTTTQPTYAAPTSSQSTNEAPKKASHRLWVFLGFLLLFLIGAGLFIFLLLKRRKRQDDSNTLPPPTMIQPGQ